MSTHTLSHARRAKKDEFYTQRSDIENELRHYAQHFRGKIVYCNCDDPYESQFFQYFILNFNRLGLKKLITTCYNGSPISGRQLCLDEQKIPCGIAHKIEVTGVEDLGGNESFDLDDVKHLLRNGNARANVKKLKGDGDFRSEECVNLLKKADIVVTNPPFSLFREYVAQLMRYEKKFVIIGNVNAITYREIFPLIKENKLWLGSSLSYSAFKVPPYYEERSSRFWIDETGQKWRSMGNVCWFSNLDISKRHEDLILFEKYSPEKYPRYDNYDAINVNKTAEIPCDYDGIMGVPITFLDKYNPDQFEILGATESEGKGFSNGLWYCSSGIAQPLINGERKYKRIFIQRKKH